MSLRVTEDKPQNVAIMQISWLMWSLDKQDCPSGNMSSLMLIKADDFAWETTHPTGKRIISILNWFRLLPGPEMSWHSTVSIHTAKHPPGLLLGITCESTNGYSCAGECAKKWEIKVYGLCLCTGTALPAIGGVNLYCVDSKQERKQSAPTFCSSYLMVWLGMENFTWQYGKPTGPCPAGTAKRTESHLYLCSKATLQSYTLHFP